MFKKILIASAMLAAVAGANAQSAPFGVSGTISPTACTLTLSGGGVADYGTMSAATVKTGPVFGGAYMLSNKLIPITVTCGAPVSVQLAFVDNKASARLASDTNDALRFGIANGSGTTAFGAYNLILDNVTVDGVTPAGYLTAPVGTATWSKTGSTGVGANYAAPSYAVGFTTAAATMVPNNLTTIGGSLIVTSRISKAIVDAATSAITLNGSGTLTLQYL